MTTADKFYLLSRQLRRIVKWQLQFALAIAFLLCVVGTVYSQDEPQDTIPSTPVDTLIVTNDGEDVVPIQSYASRYNPRKAIMLSAVLPGAGQVYNKAYWKVPIIYGGFFVFGYYGIKWNQERYTFYKDLLYNVLNEPTPIVADPDTDETALGNRFVNGQLLAPYPYNIGIETLRQRTNRYQRDRDFAVMLTALWYVLQLVEAHVDAHLKEFKVNPQLQVSVEPAIGASPYTGKTSGLALSLRF